MLRGWFSSVQQRSTFDFTKSSSSSDSDSDPEGGELVDLPYRKSDQQSKKKPRKKPAEKIVEERAQKNARKQQVNYRQDVPSLSFSSSSSYLLIKNNCSPTHPVDKTPENKPNNVIEIGELSKNEHFLFHLQTSSYFALRRLNPRINSLNKRELLILTHPLLT